LSVSSQLAQARQLRDSGRASAALDLYARAIQATPNNADAHAGRGLAYLDLSRYRQAEESFKSALEINPSHPTALMGLAETYRYQGKRPDAVALYRKYLAAHPKGEDATAASKAIQALEESP
jgi:tetratricopeptide (TPR) repeat protein